MENELKDNPCVNSSLNFNDLDDLALKCERSFSDDSSELDEEKCYLLEIEQLKRENNFLRKKLAEMNKRHRVSLPVTAKKRPPINYGAATEHRLEQPSKNYIISFIEQIVRLIQNFSSLFQVDLENTLTRQLEKQNFAFNELTSQKPSELNKRLNRILLEPEPQKYNQLLDLFQGYYRNNAERNKNIKNRVELLTNEAIEMGKRMADGIVKRENTKRSMKGSQLLSVIQEPEDNHLVREECLSSSIIKSTCTDQQIDAVSCRFGFGKDKMFQNIF